MNFCVPVCMFALNFVSFKPGSAKLCRRVELCTEQVIVMFDVEFQSVTIITRPTRPLIQ